MNTMNLTPATSLPLDIAELVLIAAIRTNISVRSLNADALSILNVLGPRQEFPTIPDSALHHMIWISLDSIAQAGDTWLLGRLLDPTVAKPSPPIRTLRSSPHVLARASEAGHLVSSATGCAWFAASKWCHSR
ncbi:hypothetical protein BCR44DRAFT_1053992 [Catenaria anguillulae PL171]|uniref:Uncharacterized protein n=1 Tax=Catenaria anguillulae PL171 TaxID=765915 RepID=A0A1Y2H4Z0_9FUNG|nr:hypothetical protein BCR44DRAFT_1053992 [Catenaria anguillulae PL171]